MRIIVAAGATALVVLAACSSPGASTAEITIFAGSSLTDVFDQLGNDFRKTDGSARLTFNFGSSSTLATQIINGAPADVFASADEENMAKVVAIASSRIMRTDCLGARAMWASASIGGAPRPCPARKAASRSKSG